MERISNGVWFSKKNQELKNYVATCGGHVYNILAVSDEMANQKAQDCFGNAPFELKEIKQ